MRIVLRYFSYAMLAINLFLLAAPGARAADTLLLHSPDGVITVRIWMEKQLHYSVFHDGKTLLERSAIDLQPEGKPALSSAVKWKSYAFSSVSAQIIPPVPEKRAVIPDRYNQLLLRFRLPYSVTFRAYDDGVAYRIATTFKDSLVINAETARFSFPGNPPAYFPEIPWRNGEDMFMTSFEDTYQFRPIDSVATRSLLYPPLVVCEPQRPKVAIIEADLENYPGMFLQSSGQSTLDAVFAAYPLEEKKLEALYSQMRVAKRAPYIARCAGTRHYPWRILMIAKEDKDLPGNDMVYRLGSPSRIADPSWIRPGHITDEWIIDLNLFNVPFKAGFNTASYKYYVDFAARFGFERIMMDAGWSDNNDLFSVVPGINMDSLLAYAKAKGVKVALWTLGMTLDRQLDSALKQFQRWGIDFIMTDFIDRDDQKAVAFHHRIAKACADHQIMIMFHGTYPPKGFSRTYPNAITREAVLGSEYNKWSTRVSPAHDVQLAYIRMLAGPLDYEPGMLVNATKTNFYNAEGLVMSYGTRCHQLAMYVVYDNPMQFFAGNPSRGWLEPDYMSFLASIPTTWDETRILDGRLGEYIVSARKKGDSWYIGGITDWTARDIQVPTAFLDSGQYEVTTWVDGPNAEKFPADYASSRHNITAGDNIPVRLAPGGGFVIVIKKKS